MSKVNSAATVGGKVLAALVCLCTAAFAIPVPAGLAVDLVVLDEQHLPVPAVEIQIKSGPTVVAKAETDLEGRAHFDQLPPGRYELTATHEGFHPLVKRDLELSESAGTSGPHRIDPAGRRAP